MSALLVSFEDFVSFKVAFKPPTKWKGLGEGLHPVSNKIYEIGGWVIVYK